MSVPTIKLNNDVEIPIVGLGTWKSPPEKVVQAVKDAIDAGYRHIDCAYAYGNEKEVGEAIAAKISEGVITRKDIFLTSKLWNTFHRPGVVESGLRTTLKNLGVDYLDLYLIHWPMGYKEGSVNQPLKPDGTVDSSDYDYVDTWKAMEEVYKKGLTRSIGISNFNSKQIERLLEKAEIVPVVNQVECHLYLNQKKLIEFCKSKGIHIEAYSPLGSPGRVGAKPEDPIVLEDQRLKVIAKKYNKSPAQVALRYQIQRGNIVIPKSVTKSRIQENFKLFDFEISAEDMSVIDTFNINMRFIHPSGASAHPYFPFNEEY
ncbi:hypothetical protein RN001_006138 [Aquatica leii]|uniref:NADP-dependent oxidoreductase domain-containing protein n=1 Tax=Aquatica leii TaxID=1421715 RepID=A0AAN7PD94_9COLE|nr:hypothetical protein RN001_006138 [Aquatica leii]